MPTTVTQTSEAYSFNELTPEAKEKARDWHREGMENHDFDFPLEDFATIAEILGITFSTHEVRLYGGTTRREPNIRYCISYSQGGGASFEGSYSYKSDASVKIREHAPLDETLHRIADALGGRPHLFAAVTRSGYSHYSHENSVDINVYDTRTDEDAEERVSVEIGQLLRDLMRWLHRQLEAERDYQYSAECVDETIAANEYLFTEAGARHPYA